MLMMVRTGAASPELIKLILNYFKELDEDGSGALTLAEICQHNKRNENLPPKEKEELQWAVKQREDNVIRKQAKRYSRVLVEPVHRRLSALPFSTTPSLESSTDTSTEGVQLQVSSSSSSDNDTDTSTNPVINNSV